MTKLMIKFESDVLKTAMVVAILIGVYGGVVFYPSQKQNQVLADEMLSKQAELNAMQKPDLKPLRENITALRAELRERSVDLPTGELHDRVLHHVSDTLLEQRVTLYETSYEKSKAYQRFSMTPIEVDFHATFPSAFRIIREIENNGPPVRIDQLEVKANEREAKGTVHVRMQMSSFFLPEEEQGGGQ